MQSFWDWFRLYFVAVDSDSNSEVLAELGRRLDSLGVSGWETGPSSGRGRGRRGTWPGARRRPCRLTSPGAGRTLPGTRITLAVHGPAGADASAQVTLRAIAGTFGFAV